MLYCTCLLFSDGADESQCEEEDYRTCSEDERACHRGKCIHLSMVRAMTHFTHLYLTSVVGPKLFFSDPAPDPTFQGISAPDTDPISDPA